ncbi:MAG TPA: transporter [Thermodesulfovibrionales bacterium]|nr:transporter [Thermodesulfovibrionales bacterium]
MFKKTSTALFLSVMVFVFYPTSSFAYRPFSTEDAGVAGKGVAQLETSWDYLSWKNRGRENVLLFVPIYGITERIELSAEIPYLFHNPAEDDSVNGIGDINLAGKLLILEESDARPAVALRGIVKTRSGSATRGLGSGGIDYSVVAVASKGLGNLTLHAMFGYAFIGNNGDDNTRNIYLYGLAADYGLTDKLHIVAEISGNRHPDRKASTEMAAGLFGATYKVSDKITLDGAVRHGFNDSVPVWSTTMGVTLTF